MALRRKISRNLNNGTARHGHFGQSDSLLRGLISSPMVGFEEVV